MKKVLVILLSVFFVLFAACSFLQEKPITSQPIKCPTNIVKLNSSEATNKIVDYLKNNAENHQLLSSSPGVFENGSEWKKDFLFSNGTIYLYFHYDEVPSHHWFVFYKAHSTKNLESEYTTDLFNNSGIFRPGKAGIFKAEYFKDKNADGSLDLVEIYNCANYELCDWKSGLFNRKTYSNELMNPLYHPTYNPSMVKFYEEEYYKNLATLSIFFECPFTVVG